ncbi:hypothetical protein TVAG_020890 [Trichomonas vaginalis G3]|uniref:Uncharacterized protein n=1 Tax=Trichomonas vaginalis (strain ATCC PRA-98 / G3) TaxID=412133 RepID=A2DH71_TRIV3|nr:regulation of choline O-acetyltransferase protein [Trichomonas vaginalis G3]EAY20144.1 hypothetical protein TVAG_020890 [Trichomonas vaginalis G3]KAI5507611.1 regulation of choline O-acetyltransferase protein [Trichomonas vaginalis G3]|eukprot:XP_001581130.1 hypothetical protein [Trichomonas vaginalis G3]
MKLSSMHFDKDPLDPNTKVLEGKPQDKPEWSFDYSDLEKEEISNEADHYASPKSNKLKAGYIVLIVLGTIVLLGAIAVIVYFVVFRTNQIASTNSVENDLNNNSDEAEP